VARRTKLGEDGNQIGAHSALLAASKQSEDGRIPHLNGSFPAFILGWTIAGMNFVLTPALTCFLSPRRGQRGERLLVGGKAVRQIQSREFSKRRRTILLLLGEKAGMREVVKPIADLSLAGSAHEAWR